MLPYDRFSCKITILYRTFPVLAISADVGLVRLETQPIIYTIGVVRDPVIQSTNGESLVPYYRVKYDDVYDMVITYFDIEILILYHDR